MRATPLDAIEQELVSEVARSVLRQAAPEELPLLRITAQAYFADPERGLAAREGKEDMIGFGVEAAIAVAPVVLALAVEAVRWLADELGKSLAAESGKAVRELIRDWLKRPESDRAVLQLTPEQLAQVRQRAYERARALRVSEPQARQLADSLVSSLLPTTAAA